jgi:hypothetical protein
MGSCEEFLYLIKSQWLQSVVRLGWHHGPMAQKLTVEVSDEVAAGVQAEAERRGTDVGGVVNEALVEHLGWQAVARIREQNADLDDEAALSLAYEELGAVRAQRRSA